MDIRLLTRFFMWCTILNAGLLGFQWLMLVAFKDFVYRMHQRWFPMQHETFNIVIYVYVGVYKILVLVFNVVPWIGLLLIA